MKKILVYLFFLFFFSFGYSQDHYLYYDNFKNEMLIRNFSGKKIGSIKLVSYYNFIKVNYYDIDDKLVKSERIERSDLTLKNFMDTKEKNPEITIFDNYSNEIGIRFWNKNINQYDLFNMDDEPMGTYKFTYGKWEYRETKNYKNSNSYATLFKPNKASATEPRPTTPSESMTQTSTLSSNTKAKKRNRLSFLFPSDGWAKLYFGYNSKSLTNVDYINMPLDKFEIGYFDWNSNYFGLQYGGQESASYEFYDEIWAFSYGRALLAENFYLKTTLGYHHWTDYNYNLYDEFYADIGMKVLLFELIGVNFIGEYNIDIKGNTSWGVGIGIFL